MEPPDAPGAGVEYSAPLPPAPQVFMKNDPNIALLPTMLPLVEAFIIGADDDVKVTLP